MPMLLNIDTNASETRKNILCAVKPNHFFPFLCLVLKQQLAIRHGNMGFMWTIPLKLEYYYEVRFTGRKLSNSSKAKLLMSEKVKM